MKLTVFLQFARSELRAIPHAYAPEKYETVDNIDLLVRVIDLVLDSGTERHQALGENFYQALGGYLTAQRHRKAALRGAIEQLAILFEGFLRTLVSVFVKDRDIELTNKEGRSRGRLSASGYMPDFMEHLFGIEVNLWEGESYWIDQPVENTCYGVCFRHQQRAKHEARNYPLEYLERLAKSVLGAYLFTARWLLQNSDVEQTVIRRRDSSLADGAPSLARNPPTSALRGSDRI